MRRRSSRSRRRKSQLSNDIIVLIIICLILFNLGTIILRYRGNKSFTGTSNYSLYSKLAKLPSFNKIEFL